MAGEDGGLSTLRPVLVAITDFDRVPVERLLQRAERLARAARPGTVAFQLRDRTRPARFVLSVGRELHRIARRHDQWSIVNDRLDLALLLDADAVHLGEGSVETQDARQLVGSRPIYRACHEPERAGTIDADAIVLSPIVAPRKGAPALGLAALARARAAMERAGRPQRLFALGGVDAESAAACLAAGADGVAAIGAAFDADDPTPLLNALTIVRH